MGRSFRCAVTALMITLSACVAEVDGSEPDLGSALELQADALKTPTWRTDGSFTASLSSSTSDDSGFAGRVKASGSRSAVMSDNAITIVRNNLNAGFVAEAVLSAAGFRPFGMALDGDRLAVCEHAAGGVQRVRVLTRSTNNVWNTTASYSPPQYTRCSALEMRGGLVLVPYGASHSGTVQVLDAATLTIKDEIESLSEAEGEPASQVATDGVRVVTADPACGHVFVFAPDAQGNYLLEAELHSDQMQKCTIGHYFGEQIALGTDLLVVREAKDRIYFTDEGVYVFQRSSDGVWTKRAHWLLSGSTIAANKANFAVQSKVNLSIYSVSSTGISEDFAGTVTPSSDARWLSLTDNFAYWSPYNGTVYAFERIMGF